MSSRRDFVRTVLLASGAVYGVSIGACSPQEDRHVVRMAPPLRTGGQRFSIAHAYLRDGTPLPAPSRTIVTDVAIIGSGMSGLATAHFLRREGIEAVLLETEPNAGGAGVSQTLNGRVVPMGSVYFVDRTDELNELMAIAGVDPVECPDDIYHVRGGVFRDLWSDNELRIVATSDQEYDGLRRFRDEVLGMGDDLPSYPIPERLPDKWRALDAMSARTYAESFHAPLLIEILDAYSRSSMGAPLELTNAYCLLNFYSSEFGKSFDRGRYAFPGGMATFTSALASSLQVRKDELVARIAPTVHGVDIDSVHLDGTVTRTTARAAVVAIPKYQLPALMPTLDAERRSAIATLRYAPYATVHVQSSRRLLAGNAYDTWHIPASDLYTDIIDSGSVHGAENGVHVASIYAPQPFNNRALLMKEESFAALAGHVVEQFTTYLGSDAADAVEHIYCWAWGHGIVVPTPGSHAGAALTARRDMGRIVFANTDNDASPAVENAAANGAIAAARIKRLLKS